MLPSLLPPHPPGAEEEPDEAAPLLHRVYINERAAGQVALVRLGGHLTQLACARDTRRGQGKH
jgi:hypothetical protein